MLSGDSIVYPVYIDPNWNVTTANSASWSDVWEAEEYSGSVNQPSSSVTPVATWTGNDWEPTDSAGGIRSGVPCDNESNGTCVANDGNEDGGSYMGNTVYRIYESSSTSPSLPRCGARPSPTASFEINQTYAWSCTNTSYVTMWDTKSNGNNTPSTTSTNWPGPGTNEWLSNSDYGYGYDPSNCPSPVTRCPRPRWRRMPRAGRGRG